MASQVPCEPKSPLSKQMWRPKQKALSKASGVATSELRLSREEKGKMPACSDNAASREVTAATIPSPNSRATTRASLVLMSEATVPQPTARFRVASLEPKHYLRLIAFAAAYRIKHHSMLRFLIHQALSSGFVAELRDRP